MSQNIRYLQRFFLVTFLILLLALIYWQVIRAPDLLARDENPRPIVAEQRIQRGAILTLASVSLAHTSFGPDGLAQRHYPYPAAAPVVGYYSLRYGLSGLEAAYDGRLRGQTQPAWLADLLHLPQVGESITVTLHLPAQMAANAALIEAGATGAVVVLAAQTGEILVMASQPTFDPNRLEADWQALVNNPDAPLLNRATQGLFPLGELARPLGLIGLFEAKAAVPADPLSASLPELLAPLNNSSLVSTANQLRFGQELSFTLPTAASPLPKDLPVKAEELSTTPLHLALVGAALAQDGLAPDPTLVYDPSTLPTYTRLMSPETAGRVRALSPKFSALVSPEVTGNEPLSWYLEVVAGEQPLVVVVGVTRPEADRPLAQAIAEAVLEAIR